MSNENGKGAGSVILTEVRELRARVELLIAHLGADRQASNGNGSGAVAPVSQIRGEHGDPEIGKPPKNWNGPSYEGCTASECPPDFLDFYADFLDWKADNPRAGKEKFAKYDRLNAQRCRRWAIEIREGRHKQEPRREPQPMAPPPGDDQGTTWTRGQSSMGMPPPPPADDDFGPPPGDDDTPF